MSLGCTNIFSFEVRRHAGRRTGLVAKNGFAVPTHCFGSIRRSICLSQISKMFLYRRSEGRRRVNNSYGLIVRAFHVDICLYTLHSEAKVVRPPLIGWATDQRPINRRFTLSLFFARYGLKPKPNRIESKSQNYESRIEFGGGNRDSVESRWIVTLLDRPNIGA